MEDRGPLDALSRAGETAISKGKEPKKNYRSLVRSLERKRIRIYEHRPEVLSIAVNGKIAASHDVQGAHNRLSSRIERPEEARFVEVFTDQNVRLALLPVQGNPPSGPHKQTEHIVLSDGRWLELVLSFDGLGLECKVAYADPALATSSLMEAVEDEGIDEQSLSVELEPRLLENQSDRGTELREQSWLFLLREQLIRLSQVRSAVWATGLIVLMLVSGYIVYHTRTAASRAAGFFVQEAIQNEKSARVAGVERQVVQVDVVGRDGTVTNAGTVERLEDGSDVRASRRFYDPNGQLVAAAWHTKDGKGSSGTSAKLPIATQSLLASGLWSRDLSLKSLEAGRARTIHAQQTASGYEVRVDAGEPYPSGIAYTVLELNQARHLVRQTVHMRSGQPFVEIRYVEKSYRRVPASSVPDREFVPDDHGISKGTAGTVSRLLSPSDDRTGRLVRLQIAILYQLSQVGVDTGEPIEVERSGDSRIRITGNLSRADQKAELLQRIGSLPDHELIDLRLGTGTRPDGKVSRHSLTTEAVYEASTSQIPSMPILNKYLIERGVPPAELEASALQFSNETLRISQRALQDAYALRRLGETISGIGTFQLDPVSKTEWTEMVNKHGMDLERQLQLLHARLDSLIPDGTGPLGAAPPVDIKTASGFAGITAGLLHQVQDLNRRVSLLFANTGSTKTEQNVDTMLREALTMLPLNQARSVCALAGELRSSPGFRAKRNSASEVFPPSK